MNLKKNRYQEAKAMDVSFSNAVSQIIAQVEGREEDILTCEAATPEEQARQNQWAGAIVFIASLGFIKALSTAWLCSTVGSAEIMDKELFNMGMKKAAAWGLALRSLEQETGAPFKAACVMLSDGPTVTMLDSCINLFCDGVDFSAEYAELFHQWEEQAKQMG